MTRLKVLLLGISCATLWTQSSAVKVLSPSPAPSLSDIFFAPLSQDATNQSAPSTTITPTISERIHASLNNVLRIPLPIWGPVAVAGTGTPTPSQQAQQQQQQLSLAPQVTGENLEQHQRQQLEQQIRLGQQPQHIGVFRRPGESQSAPPPASFLPDVNQGLLSTIVQLSTLSHWPFGYVTTSKPQQQQPVHSSYPATVATTQPSTKLTTTTTTTTSTTTPAPITSTVAPAIATDPSISQNVPPPLAPMTPTQPMAPPPFPSFVRPDSNRGPFFSYPVQSAPPPPPSLPDRIHNRIQSIGNYIRLPNLSQIGQPRPRPMLTEPPWVTELLGPTLEPPTTRAPTLGERVQNSIQNVLLFVPATLLNIWYENWGTRHVDMFVQRLQLSTPKPGSPASPVFATISQNAQNPFANFTIGGLGGNSSNPADFPAIAAFINTNGTLKPTIVHPVVNQTANTIEYQLRGENETTVLWTGTLSNDVFFGNRKTADEAEIVEIEDDEEEDKIKGYVWNIRSE